jgi:ABC-2 type transport system ATP-binding protein
MGNKKITIELQHKVLEIPNNLEKYNLQLGKNEMSLDYNYDVNAKQTGITDLLKDLKEAGLKLKDLKTEQNNLEKIFVSLVRKDNEN